MVVHAAQVTVAIGAAIGALDNHGVQITDAGATDTGGIRELDTVGGIDLVSHVGAGHQVVKMGIEGGLSAAGIRGTHVAVLVAQAGTDRPRAAMEGISRIGRPHLCHVLVAGVGVIVDAQVIDRVVAAVHAVDILDTRLDDMLLLGKGARPVELDGVLVEISLAVLVNAAIGYRHIEEVAVVRVGLVLVV